MGGARLPGSALSAGGSFPSYLSPPFPAPTSGSVCRSWHSRDHPQGCGPPSPCQGPCPGLRPPQPTPGTVSGAEAPQPTPGTMPGAEAPPAHARDHPRGCSPPQPTPGSILGLRPPQPARHTGQSTRAAPSVALRKVGLLEAAQRPGCQKPPPWCFAVQVVLSEHVASPRSETSPGLVSTTFNS